MSVAWKRVTLNCACSPTLVCPRPDFLCAGPASELLTAAGITLEAARAAVKELFGEGEDLCCFDKDGHPELHPSEDLKEALDLATKAVASLGGLCRAAAQALLGPTCALHMHQGGSLLAAAVSPTIRIAASSAAATLQGLLSLFLVRCR